MVCCVYFFENLIKKIIKNKIKLHKPVPTRIHTPIFIFYPGKPEMRPTFKDSCQSGIARKEGWGEVGPKEKGCSWGVFQEPNREDWRATFGSWGWAALIPAFPSSWLRLTAWLFSRDCIAFDFLPWFLFSCYEVQETSSSVSVFLFLSWDFCRDSFSVSTGRQEGLPQILISLLVVTLKRTIYSPRISSCHPVPTSSIPHQNT